ncbi:hypothetical protein S40293_08104 [Stachybotrys chartarum IBT 40293]|nr:hypothetical protein S40293_08104 [Stachybotrys chartarum IBT 40293]
MQSASLSLSFVGITVLDTTGMSAGETDSMAGQHGSQLSNGQGSQTQPDGIFHITDGFIPLSLLLTRLAQTTHNALQAKMVELAKMPLPAAAMNGNTAHANSADDVSSDNLRKKTALLNFAQDMHAKWVKVLVIADWSRKAESVSKLIDLKFHIDQQRILFDAALDNIVNIKRDLTYARMPSPDLKTALQVLSTGRAPWIPDLQYIPLPQLTADEQVKWMNDLDTLLSIRLNLEDYDKIPQQFKNYDISSGRVTFKVPGEFEVDLTIADEDFEKQFWFIDFRFAFSPAAQSLPESLRIYLEGCVNDALARDGLTGCYQFLHEYVLTMKIHELRRQAIQLSKTSWTGTLMVEPLHRALAIQYWTPRTAVTKSKSWVLVAINSGRKQNTPADAKAASYLVAKWYRDGKEVKDVEIPLDADNLSAESLLKTVVGRHVESILTSIHDKLLTAPRFQNREAGLKLRISKDDPTASSLKTQVGYRNSAALLIEPSTGAFAIKPHSKFVINYERQLNNGKTPIDDGVMCLEQVRCAMLEDELNRRGSCMGWVIRKAPITNEELHAVTKTRGPMRVLWLQKNGWRSNWFVAIILSLAGDQWWLLETSDTRAVPFYARLPLRKGHPDLTDKFWDNLTLFSTGMLAQSVDMRELHRRSIKSRPNETVVWSLPQQVRLPALEVALSAIYPAMLFDSAETESDPPSADQTALAATISSILRTTHANRHPASQPWAFDLVTIKFRGVEVQPVRTESSGHGTLQCLSDAFIKVRKPARYATLSGSIDRDVSYNSRRGEFCLRLRHVAGQSLIDVLETKVKAIDRFVTFLDALDRAKDTIECGKVTLREVTFFYGSDKSSAGHEGEQPQKWRVVLDLSEKDIDVQFEQGNPHLRVVDLAKTLVNAADGINGLLHWLPTSLPTFRTIDDIQSRWEDFQAQNRGQVDFIVKTMDWMRIHYDIAQGASTGASDRRHLVLEMQCRLRRDEPWWHIRRSAEILVAGVPVRSDDFTNALDPIWQGRGDGWHGLASGASGRHGEGVAALLQVVDNAIYTVATASWAVEPDGTGNAPLVVVD